MPNDDSIVTTATVTTYRSIFSPQRASLHFHFKRKAAVRTTTTIATTAQLMTEMCTGESNTSVWHEIMKVLKGNSYNRYFRPEKESGNITVVFVNVYVESVGIMDSSKV
uniref:Uncharacterized protein n=1 Tax=Octopus bimaculoides TaxID=37653 RepID=A0A0L8HZ33_OCTBM